MGRQGAKLGYQRSLYSLSITLSSSLSTGKIMEVTLPFRRPLSLERVIGLPFAVTAKLPLELSLSLLVEKLPLTLELIFNFPGLVEVWQSMYLRNFMSKDLQKVAGSASL